MYSCELATSPPLVSRHELKVLASRRVIQLESEQRERWDVSPCCAGLNVSSPCLFLCQPGPPAPASSLTDCQAELGHLYSCLGDRQEQSQCCEESGVPQECAGPCSGQTSSQPAPSCLTFSPAILSCLRTGQQTVPSPPLAVSASPQDDTSVSVNWLADLPSLHLVHHYNINLTFIA